ncbi:sulfatase-like hydrolase/transferase [Chitinophaga pollutisoli]|uniref:Sulfatase-like hydrolase/transferase n=1 Tax=Chitinophaga pollutisoli TaxID=3133966 RepID=A0ABZ2YZC4_9BACT
MLLATSLPAAAQTSQRPNIIFIFSDDHAFQAVSAYGGKLAQTQNIDRIARKGAIFRHALVTHSICGPSRATLLTGKYSHRNGYPRNEQKFDVTQVLFLRVLQPSPRSSTPNFAARFSNTTTMTHCGRSTKDNRKKPGSILTGLFDC